ncbi:hypothetical protein GPZ77_34315 (plasmid) [Streptomyces sp. QHH-9511]|uniref:response regulator transcription factor n=1 Tax=Streptomyces sp. QHH-9511 TaxID=2684468 RepID=UPI001318C543|nr:helix-turn-helix transcriptional regulator [Streptomyces sp. QHH-9511]QGZ53307.1 hypothetical protein GPZ77_34315 [Streptomyces sp. QHH-9511]
MSTSTKAGPSSAGGGPDPYLTDNELAVLQGAAYGETYASIAKRLGYAEKSVSKMALRLSRKLGARNMTHAVLLACRAGILDGRPQRHGDRAGFMAHVRRGEQPCDACREGRNAFDRAWRASRKAEQSHAA